MSDYQKIWAEETGASLRDPVPGEKLYWAEYVEWLEARLAKAEAVVELREGQMDAAGLAELACHCCGEKFVTGDAGDTRCSSCCWTCHYDARSKQWEKGERCPKYVAPDISSNHHDSEAGPFIQAILDANSNEERDVLRLRFAQWAEAVGDMRLAGNLRARGDWKVGKRDNGEPYWYWNYYAPDQPFYPRGSVLSNWVGWAWDFPTPAFLRTDRALNLVKAWVKNSVVRKAAQYYPGDDKHVRPGGWAYELAVKHNLI